MENLARQPEFDFEHGGYTMPDQTDNIPDHAEEKFDEHGLPIITRVLGKREKVSIGAKVFREKVLSEEVSSETYDAWYQALKTDEYASTDDDLASAQYESSPIIKAVTEKGQEPPKDSPADKFMSFPSRKDDPEERPGFNALPRGDRW
jgi:hypothetical protein